MNETNDTLTPSDGPSSAPSGSAQCLTCAGAGEVSAIEDAFNGDGEHLRSCIKALINMNDDGVLVPHGIGGHARALLAACYHRIGLANLMCEDLKNWQDALGGPNEYTQQLIDEYERR
jgi:hypothetical protein